MKNDAITSEAAPTSITSVSVRYLKLLLSVVTFSYTVSYYCAFLFCFCEYTDIHTISHIKYMG